MTVRGIMPSPTMKYVRADDTYIRDDRRGALVLMIAYTLAGLWLLSTPSI
jgi:hypothetical protein